MAIKRMVQSVVIVSLLIGSSLAFAQYEAEPYIEGYIGADLVMPMGYIKNDLSPDGLNAKLGWGMDAGAGYYFSSSLVGGLYFDLRDMKANDYSLHHRMYEVGAYGKYFISGVGGSATTPYVKVSGGMSFSNLVTKVAGEMGPAYRELAYPPTIGAEAALGVQHKTNEYGGIYLELGFHMDMTDGVTGDFRSVDYPWGGNNTFVMIRGGVMVNIGPKE
jgi:hypothetical protein